MIRHIDTDTVGAIVGFSATTAAWIADLQPVVVIISGLVTIGFTLHKWLHFLYTKKK